MAAAFFGISACEQAIGPFKMDFKQIKKAIREQTGIPVPVVWADKE
ncbi:MAG: hypothetical protein U9N19_00980 [Thermodesulfobacteriota bacterium]|nr:hypothetical protein [Thermodesulfobacteriota bacterium]